MAYLSLKYLHIMSMVLLLGTGLGSAYYKWMADRSGNVAHIAATNRHVVLADWIFTTPTIIFQPISGVWLLYLLEIPITTPWVVASFLLFGLAGACWLPVVWLQIRMHQLADDAVVTDTPLSPHYWRYALIWFRLGVPAFFAMVLIVLLMVFKSYIGG